MARGYKRRIEESEGVGDDEALGVGGALASPFGPWKRSDRPQFDHLAKEVQEWLIRLSPEDLEDMQGAIRAFVRRKIIWQWLRLIFWGVTTGFGAVYVAGERLAAFFSHISGTNFSITSIGAALRGLFGL